MRERKKEREGVREWERERERERCVKVIQTFPTQSQILHSTSLEFHQKLEDAEDLDEMIKLHQDYTNIIFDRCLLNKKVGYIITDTIYSPNI